GTTSDVLNLEQLIEMTAALSQRRIVLRIDLAQPLQAQEQRRVARTVLPRPNAEHLRMAGALYVLRIQVKLFEQLFPGADAGEFDLDVSTRDQTVHADEI